MFSFRCLPMSDLLQLSAPWWHFALRAVAVYALVMLLVRLSGKRAVGQFTPFESICGRGTVSQSAPVLT